MSLNSTDVLRDVAYKGRGLEEARRRLGPILDHLDAAARRKQRPRILEIGCGFGTALIEINAHLRGNVDLCGLNLSAMDGDQAALACNAERLGLAGLGDAITLMHGDFEDNTTLIRGPFDLIFSQVAWLYMKDKISALTRVHRLLDDNGTALIEALHWPVQNMGYFGSLLDIQGETRRFPPLDLLRRYATTTYSEDTRSASIILDKACSWPPPLNYLGHLNVKAYNGSYIGTKSIYSRATA